MLEARVAICSLVNPLPANCAPNDKAVKGRRASALEKNRCSSTIPSSGPADMCTPFVPLLTSTIPTFSLFFKSSLRIEPADVAAAGNPVGGYEWLNAHPDFNPLSLCILSDNVGCARLAGGTYLLKIKYLGKTQLILNPFHGYQLVPFIKQGSALVVFEGRSKTSWNDLRNKLCGATDPEAAEAGSVRNELLVHKAKIGMVDVNKGSNGVHMSAGPLEGMVELQRFFSNADSRLPFTSLSFGAALSGQGLTEAQIATLASNIDVAHAGKNVSVFDLTEEMDVAEAAPLLKSVLPQ